MRYLLAIFLTTLSISAIAQKQKNWYILPQLGLLNGTDLVSGQVMLNGGIVHKGWDLGLGVGADYYGVRTVPIIVDVRRNIGVPSLFAYTNIGYNVAAPLKEQYMYPTATWGHSQSSFSNGWYGEMGLGYDLTPKKSGHVVLSVGYSVKTAAEQYTETIPRDFPPYYGELNERRYDYRFKRIVFKLGLRL